MYLQFVIMNEIIDVRKRRRERFITNYTKDEPNFVCAVWAL